LVGSKCILHSDLLIQLQTAAPARMYKIQSIDIL
jgi:hypothetical protein